jgi:hypothetical protein
MDSILIFHPPSLRNPLTVPVDDPRETCDRFFDVFQRTSLRTWRFRMELLRHAQPSEPPWAVKTNVEHVMQYNAGLNLWGSADGISKAVRRVYVKRIGKQRGLFSIEQDLREAVESRFLRHGDWDKAAAKRIDDYIDERMGYIGKSFRGLNSPMFDGSDERAEFIGDYEDRSARNFGRTLGWEFSDRQVSKIWVAEEDACEICLDNADEGPIPVDEDFPSGDYTAPAHLFCRCGVQYVEDEE